MFDITGATEATSGIKADYFLNRFTHVDKPRWIIKQLLIPAVPGNQVEVTVNHTDTLVQIFDNGL